MYRAKKYCMLQCLKQKLLPGKKFQFFDSWLMFIMFNVCDILTVS